MDGIQVTLQKCGMSLGESCSKDCTRCNIVIEPYDVNTRPYVLVYAGISMTGIRDKCYGS
jgi:hypothetical protein